jgi:hypothetical protein
MAGRGQTERRQQRAAGANGGNGVKCGKSRRRSGQKRRAAKAWSMTSSPPCTQAHALFSVLPALLVVGPLCRSCGSRVAGLDAAGSAQSSWGPPSRRSLGPRRDKTFPSPPPVSPCLVGCPLRLLCASPSGAVKGGRRRNVADWAKWNERGAAAAPPAERASGCATGRRSRAPLVPRPVRPERRDGALQYAMDVSPARQACDLRMDRPLLHGWQSPSDSSLLLGLSAGPTARAPRHGDRRAPCEQQGQKP